MTSPLWKVSVTTSLEAEDAVANLLTETFQQPASSYTDAINLRTRVTAYLDRKPRRDGLELVKLRAGLQRMRSFDLEMGYCRVSFSKVQSKDWANSWKRHFKPIEFGTALLIRPSWSKRRPRNGQALVQIDPGLAFGTGKHPTTSFCLRELVARREVFSGQSFLDLGTGSGILAIAAAKLGYAPIEAIDLDPAAIKVSRANARSNRVEQAIRFRQKNLSKLPSRGTIRYTVICANLIANVLLTERQRILARLQPGGVLVLAGILSREFSEVKRHYTNAGLTLLSSFKEKEWQSGSFGVPPLA